MDNIHAIAAMMSVRGLALGAALVLPQASAAQDVREFCPDRPGLGTPACTIDRGDIAVEMGGIDWTLDRQPGSRTNTLVAGDLLVRYGVTDTAEVQAGWTAFGLARIRSGGLVESRSGTGDVTVAVRQNLRNPDGSGVSVAVMPFVTLPVGGSTIGAGDWGGGLLIPGSIELPEGLGLAITGSIEAAVDADRDGRHLAYGGVIGLDVPLTQDVGATFELAATRDRDPSGAVTELLAGFSGAWSPSDVLQFDVGANLGLTRNAPDLQLSLGVARRF